MQTHPIARLFASLLAFGGLAAVPPAGADALVTVSGTRNGAVVDVTGSAALFDGPLVPVASDPTGDTQQPGTSLAGDLVDVSLSSQSDGDLLARWTMNSLPADPVGVTSLARFRFRAGTTDYEVAAARRDLTAMDGCISNGLPCSAGWLLRCGTTCAWTPAGANGGGTVLSRDLVVTTNSPGRYIQAVIPAALLSGVLSPGSVLQPLGGNATEALTAFGILEQAQEADSAEMTGPYTYGLTVSLGAGQSDADPTTIAYTVPAQVAPDFFGFAGSLEVPQGEAVFAKACLGGPTNCAYGSTEAL